MPLFDSAKRPADAMDVDLAQKKPTDDDSDDDLSSIDSDDIDMTDAPASAPEPGMNNITNIQAYFTLKPSSTPPTTSPSTTKTTTTAPTQPSTTPNKRKRLTDAERAAKAAEDAAKKKEKEEARLAKLAEKAAADAEKAAAKAKAEAEKAAAKTKLEAERAAKQAEKDERRRKKEEEERKIQDEKEKKERSQMRLNSFFTRPLPMKGVVVTEKKVEESKKEAIDKEMTEAPVLNDYQRTFKPFFVRDNVQMAPLPNQQMDAAAREAKTRIFTEYIQRKRGDYIKVTPFDVLESLRLPRKPRRRGIMYPSVKQLVEDMTSSEFGDPKSERARKALEKVPVKTLFFSTDLRPAYCGTVTNPQVVYGQKLLEKAARHPISQILPNLAYDYDSEAEWFDDELGEDLDMDDEEEEVDDEDDMDGFLDDSEDAGLARGGWVNNMEPESTGVCFEDGRGRTGVSDLNGYRMEFILQSVPGTRGLDPWSSEYWEVEKKPMAPPAGPSGVMPEGGTVVGEGKEGREKVTLELKRPELLPEIKKTILENAKLSKLGLIDVLFHQVEGLSKGEAKTALDVLATKVGTGRVKQWALKEEVRA